MQPLKNHLYRDSFDLALFKLTGPSLRLRDVPFPTAYRRAILAANALASIYAQRSAVTGATPRYSRSLPNLPAMMSCDLFLGKPQEASRVVVENVALLLIG